MGWEFDKAKGRLAERFYKKYGHKLKVAYKEYDLIASDGYIKDEHGFNQGLCVFTKKQIFVNAQGKEVDETVLHELIHAILESTGFHQMPSWTIDLEELLCENISNAIIANFKISKR